MSNPIVTTKRWKIDNVARAWDRQYPFDKKNISARLHALPPGATEDQVTAIIGNDTWTRNFCDQCGGNPEKIVTVGAEKNYDSATADLCRDCLVAALKALDEA